MLAMSNADIHPGAQETQQMRVMAPVGVRLSLLSAPYSFHQVELLTRRLWPRLPARAPSEPDPAALARVVRPGGRDGPGPDRLCGLPGDAHERAAMSAAARARLPSHTHRPYHDRTKSCMICS